MDGDFLLPALAFMTLGVVIVLAIISKKRTDARHDDPKSPKSTLASDAPDEHAPYEQRSDLPPATPDQTSDGDAHVPVEPNPNPPKPHPPQADTTRGPGRD